MTTLAQILDWCLHGGPIAALCCLAGGVLLLVCLIDTMLRRAMPALAIIVIGAVFQLELDTAVSADVLPSPLTPRVAGLLIAGIPAVSLGFVLLVSQRYAAKTACRILAAAVGVACCLGLFLDDGSPEARALLKAAALGGDFLAACFCIFIFQDARALALSPLTPKPWRFTAAHWREAKLASGGWEIEVARGRAALPALALTVALTALLHAGLAVGGLETGLVFAGREFGPGVSWTVWFSLALLGWLAGLAFCTPDDSFLALAAQALVTLVGLCMFHEPLGDFLANMASPFPNKAVHTSPVLLLADFAAGVSAVPLYRLLASLTE